MTSPNRTSRGFGLSRRARRFLRDDAAASAVFFAVSLSSTIGLVGLGVETGAWFSERRQYQTAADAGAIAGALQMISQLNANNTATPTLDTTANGPAWKEAVRNGASTFVVNTSVQQLATPTRAHVEVSEVKNTLLARVSSLQTVTINTVAEAVVDDLGQPCINALGTTGTVIQIQGSTSVTSPNCVLTSNSTATGTSNGANDPPSVSIQGGSNTVVKVAEIYSPGSIVSGGSPNVGAPLGGMGSSTSTADPFSSIPAPPTVIPTATATIAGGTCKSPLPTTGGTPLAGTLCKTNGQQNSPGNVSLTGHAWPMSNANDVSGNLSIGGTGSSSITTSSANTYNISGDLSIGSGTTATLNGIYHIGGNLSIGSNATMNGTYYVGGNLTVSAGTVNMNGTYYVTGGITFSGGTVAVVSDNMYGNNLSVTGATVTVNGTVYVINSTAQGGTFSVSSGSISTPTGGSTTIVVGGANSYIDINSNTIVHLTAPTLTSTSLYKGLALYQDPTSTHTSTLQSSDSKLVGGVYARSAEVDFGGNAGSTCTIIVAKIISFTGNSSLDTTGCANYATLPHFYKVSLSE